MRVHIVGHEAMLCSPLSPSYDAEEGSRESVDAKCRQLTASWVRERAKSDESIEVCDFFEGHEKAGSEALLPAGVGLRVMYTVHFMN